MSDQKKNRFAVDLDEIERQIRLSEQSSVQNPRSVPLYQENPSYPQEGGSAYHQPISPVSSASQQPAPWENEASTLSSQKSGFQPEYVTSPAQPSPLQGRLSDPLSELARIVGQSDPFDALLASGGKVSRPSPSTQVAEGQTTEDRQVYNTYGAAKAAQRSQQKTQQSQSIPSSCPAGSETGLHQRSTAPSYDYQENQTGYSQPDNVSDYRQPHPPAEDYAYASSERTQVGGYQYDNSYEESYTDHPGYETSHNPPAEGYYPGTFASDPFTEQRQSGGFHSFPPETSDTYGYGHPPQQGAEEYDYAEKTFLGADNTPSGYHEQSEYTDYGEGSELSDYEDEYERRSRWPFVLAGTLSLLLVAGGGYFFMSGDTKDRPPPLITAQTDPVKIIPDGASGDSGNSEENHGIYGDSQEGQVKIVDGEEQPVDVASNVRVISPNTEKTLGQDGHTIDIEQQIQNREKNFDLRSPKPVQTLTVRADGSIVFPEENSENSPDETPPAENTETASLNAPPDVTGNPDVAESNEHPDTMTPDASSTTTPAEPTPEQSAPQSPDATVVDSNVSTPQQVPPPPTSVEPPAPRPREPLRLQPAARPVQQTAERSDSGAESNRYTVQLGIANSETEALNRFETLKRRFPGELGGASPIIRKAEVNGTSIYRIRVPAGSRDDARDFCSRLSSAGGDCFVSRN